VRSTSGRLDTSNIFLALCLVVFIVFLIDTHDMEEASSYLLPRLVCILGLVVGSIKLIASYLRPPRNETEDEEGEDGAGLPVAYAILFAAGYFLATPWLGFVLSTAIAMLAFSHLMRFPRKKLALVLSIAIPMLLHLVFVRLLQASLPAGILGSLFS